MFPSRLFGLLFLVCSISLVAGCGQSDQEQAEGAVTGYLGGLADGDGAKACSHLTGNAKRELSEFLAKQLGGYGDFSVSCEAQIEELSGAIGEDERPLLRDAEVEVSVDGNSATAYLAGGDGRAITLVMSGDEWLIDKGFTGP